MKMKTSGATRVLPGTTTASNSIRVSVILANGEVVLGCHKIERSKTVRELKDELASLTTHKRFDIQLLVVLDDRGGGEEQHDLQELSGRASAVVPRSALLEDGKQEGSLFKDDGEGEEEEDEPIFLDDLDETFGEVAELLGLDSRSNKALRGQAMEEEDEVQNRDHDKEDNDPDLTLYLIHSAPTVNRFECESHAEWCRMASILENFDAIQDDEAYAN